MIFAKMSLFSSIFVKVYLRAPTELAYFPGHFRKHKRSSFTFCFRYCVWQLSSQLLVFNSVEILQSCEIIQIQRFASDRIQLLFENEDGTEDMGNYKQNMKLERLGFPKHPWKFATVCSQINGISDKWEFERFLAQNWLLFCSQINGNSDKWEFGVKKNRKLTKMKCSKQRKCENTKF